MSWLDVLFVTPSAAKQLAVVTLPDVNGFVVLELLRGDGVLVAFIYKGVLQLFVVDEVDAAVFVFWQHTREVHIDLVVFPQGFQDVVPAKRQDLAFGFLEGLAQRGETEGEADEPALFIFQYGREGRVGKLEEVFDGPVDFGFGERDEVEDVGIALVEHGEKLLARLAELFFIFVILNLTW